MMSSNQFFDANPWDYRSAETDTDGSSYPPPTTSNDDALQLESSTDPSSQYGEDFGFQNSNLDQLPDYGSHAGDHSQAFAPLVPEIAGQDWDLSQDVDCLYVGESVPLPANSLANFPASHQTQLSRALEAPLNAGSFLEGLYPRDPGPWSPEFASHGPSRSQAYSQPQDHSDPLGYDLASGAATHVPSFDLTPRYVGGQHGLPMDMVPFQGTWNGPQMNPPLSGSFAYQNAQYGGHTAHQLDAVCPEFRTDQSGVLSDPGVDQGLTAPPQRRDHGNIGPHRSRGLVSAASRSPGPVRSCWACFGKKEECDGPIGSEPCAKCKRRASVRNWKIICNNEKFQDLWLCLFPSTLEKSLSQTRIKDYHTTYSFRFDNAPEFPVAISVGFGVPLTVMVRVFWPTGENATRRTVLRSYIENGSIVRRTETCRVYPIALAGFGEYVACQTRAWLDDTVRNPDSLDTWIVYNFGMDPSGYVNRSLRAVCRYVNACGVVDTSHQTEPIDGVPFQILPEPDKLETLRFALKLVVLMTIMRNGMQLDPQYSEVVRRNVDFLKVGPVDTGEVSMLLSAGLKGCMAEILTLLIQRTLSGLNSMLRFRGKGIQYTAPISCVLTLLSIAIGLQQVSLDSINPIRTALGDYAAINEIESQIGPMEVVILSRAIEYARNLHGTHAEILQFCNGKSFDQPTEALFLEFSRIFREIDQHSRPLHQMAFTDLNFNDRGDWNIPRLVAKVIHGLLMP